jgi:hypothetical protein
MALAANEQIPNSLLESAGFKMMSILSIERSILSIIEAAPI